MAEIRLQRYLAQCGVAARRKAEQLIVDGVVEVNGKVVTVLGTKVDPATAHVTVDGKTVRPEELCYVILNKPKASISSVTDPHDRRTVMEYVYGLPARVAPVGRLDYYSEGVLLLTNDGELSAALQSPHTKIDKVYHVKVRGHVTESHIVALSQGVRLDDGAVTRPARVDRLSAKSNHDWLEITLTEGKSRQIHRMLDAFGYQVLKLQRVAFAGITFHGLRIGDARELTQSEVDNLRSMVDLPTDRRAVSTGEWRLRREQTDSGRRIRDRARRVTEQERAGVAGVSQGPRVRPAGRGDSATAPPPRADGSRARPDGSRAGPRSTSSAPPLPGRGRPSGAAARPGSKTRSTKPRSVKPGGKTRSAKPGSKFGKAGGRSAKPGSKFGKAGRGSSRGGKAPGKGGRGGGRRGGGRR